MKGRLKKPIALLMIMVMVLSIGITALAQGDEAPSSDINGVTQETVTAEEEPQGEEPAEEDVVEGEKDEGDGDEGDGEGLVEGEGDAIEDEGEEDDGIAEDQGDGDEEAVVEEEVDLGDNPDHITANEANIKALGFYYPVKPGKRTVMLQNGGETGGTGWPNPGAINLTKEAKPDGDSENQWEVTLTIEGKNIQKTSKVVLVIDKSGSMKGEKMANTISAAQEFVERLLLEDGLTEIAVVSFDGNAYVVSDFVGHSDKDNLKTKIGKIKADGGTNIQAGIYQARILLEAATADNKVMVLLGDGEATYSFKVTKASGITLSSHDKDKKNPDINYNDPEIIEVDYTNIVGSGSAYTLAASGGFPSKVYRYQIYCNESGHNHGPWTTTFPSNNGIPTIWEAGLAKDKGTKIYSIALNAGTNGEEVLEGCASNGEGYYYELNNDDLDLSDVFSEIAGQIAYAANNAIVIDPMGEMFDLVTAEIDIYVSQGTAKIIETNKIKWTVGTIKESSPAVMKYKIKIKDGADKNFYYPTNGITTIEYKDINGKDAKDEFEVPEVSISGGKILFKGYLVNDEGKPVNEVGTVVERPDLAKRLYDHTYSETPLDFNITYIITKSTVAEHQYMGYVWNESNGTKETVSVLLQATAPTQTVWFGYKKIVGPATHTVTFNENYEGAPGPETQTVVDGEKAVRPVDPVREDYTFIGWYEAGSNEPFNFDTPITGDKTLYAQWEDEVEPEKYIVTYINEAGEDESIDYPYSEGDTVIVIGLPEGFTKPVGKHFAGWEYRCMEPTSVVENGNGNEIKVLECGDVLQPGDEFKMPNRDISLYAIWEINKYTVTFKDYDGTTLKTETVNHGGNATAPSSPSRSGYTFTGWDKGFTNITGNLVVTAQYKSTGGGGSTGGGSTSGGGSSPSKPKEEVVIVPEEEIPADLPLLNKRDHFQYIQGYPDGTVKPEGLISRDEVAAVFYRLLDPEYREKIKTTTHKFSDVAPERWSNKHIATLAKGGIITGYLDGTFKPGNYITRSELATIASRFDNLSPFTSDKFSDIKGHWANKYINSAAEKGWVKGYVDGTFKPDQYITRAEFVTLVNNVLERRVTRSEILPGSKKFPDLPEDKWFYEAMMEAVNSHYYERLDDGYENWLEIYYPVIEM